MHPAVRVGLVLLGAAAAVYGAASLTGGWLGLAPWERERVSSMSATEQMHLFWTMDEYREDLREHGSDPENRYITLGPVASFHYRLSYPITEERVRESFDGVAWLVVLSGVSVAGVGAWPRRRSGRAA